MTRLEAAGLFHLCVSTWWCMKGFCCSHVMVDPIVSGRLCRSTLCAHEVGFAVRKKLWLHECFLMNMNGLKHIIVVVNKSFI